MIFYYQNSSQIDFGGRDHVPHRDGPVFRAAAHVVKLFLPSLTLRLHISAQRQLHTGRTLVMDHKIDGSNPAIRSGIGEMANEKKNVCI